MNNCQKLEELQRKRQKKQEKLGRKYKRLWKRYEKLQKKYGKEAQSNRSKEVEKEVSLKTHKQASPLKKWKRFEQAIEERDEIIATLRSKPEKAGDPSEERTHTEIPAEFHQEAPLNSSIKASRQDELAGNRNKLFRQLVEGLIEKISDEEKLEDSIEVEDKNGREISSNTGHLYLSDIDFNSPRSVKSKTISITDCELELVRELLEIGENKSGTKSKDLYA